MDVLSRLLNKATEHGIIGGLGTNIIPHGVVCLQYADDTIIFLDKDLEKARNMKWILSCFELMSGTRINYSKSELVSMNLDDQKMQDIFDIFGCPVGLFQLNILVFPFITKS